MNSEQAAAAVHHVHAAGHAAASAAAAATTQASDAVHAAAATVAQSADAAANTIWPHLPGHWPAQTDLLTVCQTMGALTAALLGEKAGNATAGAMVGGFAAAAATWPMMKYAVAVMGGVFGLLLGASIWRAAGLQPTYAWSGGLTGLVFFGMLSFLLFRGSIMMYTSLQGSVMLVFGLLGLIYKYQEIAPKVSDNLSARTFILPLCIFVPATLGLIWQQTQYPAPAGPGPKK